MSVSFEKVCERIFDNFKKITPALTAISLLTGMVLFLPQKILKIMNLDELPLLWKRIIGIIFLLSTALIITIVFFSIFSFLATKMKNKRAHLILKKKYKLLSPKQKAIVLEALTNDKKMIVLDKASGDTVYLVNNLFLHTPEQVFSVDWGNIIKLKYVPHPWLIDLYNEDPNFFAEK